MKGKLEYLTVNLMTLYIQEIKTPPSIAKGTIKKGPWLTISTNEDSDKCITSQKIKKFPLLGDKN